VSPRAALVFLL